MRIYDPRLGRFLSVDPLTGSYPELTPYQFASNTPIESIDLDGLERYSFKFITEKNGKTHLKCVDFRDEDPFGNVYTDRKFTVENTDGLHYSFNTIPEMVKWNMGGQKGVTPNEVESIELLKVAGQALLMAHDEAQNEAAKYVLSKNSSSPDLNPPTIAVPKQSFKVNRGNSSLVNKNVSVSPFRLGHTFTKHGSGNTNFLTKLANGSNTSVGQWLDDVIAQKFIGKNLGNLKNGAIEIPIPKGLGRIVNPDGSFTEATHAVLVPSGTGVKTAYPSLGNSLKNE
jgi:hypothetical protein